MKLPLLLGFALTLSLALAQPAGAGAPAVRSLDIAPVWSGHPVGFALLTDAVRNRQYAAYYAADRSMVVASRTLDSDAWTPKVLPTRIVWDSHNYVTLALDRDGHLHVSGNMHVSPLVYFRTTKAGDVSTLKRVPAMAGDRESRMTYPRFLNTDEGGLVFSYRDGGSGRGSTLYNRYDEKTRSWTRLLEQPLFDGQRPAGIPRPAHDNDDMMNAYPLGPVRGPDGWWHMTWVWRDTPRAETNHDLGYARSRNLTEWETIDGRPIALPISLATPGVTVDPIPAHGGIINGSGKIGFDLRNRVVITYHKFDDAGLTQLYNARHEDSAWKIRPLTRWEHRWDFRGTGSGPASANNVRISHSEVRAAPGIGLYLATDHSHHGKAIRQVDPDTLELGPPLRSEQLPDHLPAALLARRSDDPRMGVRTAADSGTPPPGVRYLLRWETLPVNRDRPHDGPIPPPSLLQLVTLSSGLSGPK